MLPSSDVQISRKICHHDKVSYRLIDCRHGYPMTCLVHPAFLEVCKTKRLVESFESHCYVKSSNHVILGVCTSII